MTNCKNCGAERGCGKPDCDGSESPSCKTAPEHCDQCPPWICDDCHETCSSKALCSCWTQVADINFADLKGIFAASDMSLEKRDD